MSQFADRGAVTACGRIRNVPLLELLAENMEANRCIDELLKQLEEERRNVRREKLAVARLQREVARSKSEGTMREKLILQLEEERHLRLESEKRLREVTEEAELGRAQMVSLQQQFSRMEETVRSLLQNQTVDTVDIMKVYKDKLSEEETKQPDGPGENGTSPDPDPEASRVEEDGDKTKDLLERLKALEEQNCALALENENQREQYERCLDEVANQVVQALLTQKDLREECLKLRTRVFDLEQQNRALSVLFQQKIKPASDLLLQKLHSRILDLSAADLLLEPERSKAFLLSRHSDGPANEPAGKSAERKCLSQLSLAPPPAYPRSSCSSSELSLSSACSDFSSGSYTWNDGRSSGKQSSLTWEKRLSLGSSAPSNICAPPEEQQPTRRKESHILEGLRKLQRRRHRSSSASSKASKSGYKDCMNSNEGIYSLGIKSGAKVCKPSPGGATKKFSYDSDDADDELVHSSHGDNIPTRDNWLYCQRLSHSVSDSLCSWEGTQDGPARPSPGYGSKDGPEELLSFINSFLPEGGRTSAFTKPSKLRSNPADPEEPQQGPNLGPEPPKVQSERAERDSKRLSRDTAKLLTQQWLRREQGRTQSADGRPRPFSLIKDPPGPRCTQSEESILAIFDAEGEPIELAQKDAGGVPESRAEYSELVPQERPTRQKAASSRDYSVLESTSEHQLRTSRSRENSSDRLSMQLTPQRKLIKPPSSRANRGHSIPPMNDCAAARSAGSKIPGGTKPSGSPLRLSKDSITEPSTGGPPQEKSPCSPTVKTSRINKTASSCSHSPKAVSSRLPGRTEWKSPAHRRPVYADHGEQPTRDKHCEPNKNKLRSPSPPPPPGRTTSLLVRPNYEGSPQAHKPWVAQPSTPTTVRGPPPSYHISLLPNMQSTLPIKDKDCSEQDAGYGTALAPQRLVDRTSQHLHKSPATAQSSAKGTARRSAKTDYLPSANSGCVPETDNAPKGFKNVPPPYSALRGSSVQSSFISKRGPAHENVHLAVQKPSVSLPASLQDVAQSKTAPKVVSPPSSITLSPNTPEKASKSRIPMGFKAFLKSPPTNKNSPSVAGKQEKDHINSVSKETVASHASSQCENFQPASVSSPARSSVADGAAELQVRGQEEEVAAEVSPEDDDPKGNQSSQLFSRSISVTTKAHLKPALGMTGAKARSQSFSANYMEKPSVHVPEGPGKIRTQIITNSGERGNSLTRQSSLEVPAESPIHSPRSRLSHYGGMTASPGHGLLVERTKSGSRGEGPPAVTLPSQKEARSLAGNERPAVNIRKAAKVSSHPFQTPPSSGQTSQKPAAANHESDFGPEPKTQMDSSDNSPEISPSACTIEEKVMMGIEENVQKCQEQEKVASSETKHRTGPSLANWFGLRRSKLPALSGKKAESPKGKDEKKELKIGSVLGGKSDKKKEKKKSENQEGQSLLEVNNKLSSIMDHCNNHMGQIASHIQSSTGFMGKEQLVRELLGRAAVKGSCVSPPAIPAARKHSEMKEICCDTATLLISQKIQLRDVEEVPDSSCQDHMMGSGCQTRTLDSGIGTFPLPDSVTRAGARHIPKSESSPDRVTADSASSHPDPSQSDVKVPSLPQPRLHDPPSMGHSQSESSVTSSQQDRDVQKRPPTCSDAIRTKRWSLVSPRSVEDKHKDIEKKKKMTEFESPRERALQVCTYSGSSSDTETEGETSASPHRKLMSRMTRSRSAEEGQDTLKRRSQDGTPTIMKLYQQDVLSRLEDGRRITQCTLLQRETSLGGDAADRLSKEIIMEAPPIEGNDFSLNKLNHGAACGGSPFLVPGFAVMGGDEPSPSSSGPGLDPVGSLSDSLYESFSSCTSQGSNDV